MDTYEEILDRAKQARDDAYYEKCYSLFLFMAGAEGAENETLTKGTGVYRADADLGEYPMILPQVTSVGVQNHALVNSRIAVQSVVYADPEFRLVCDDPVIRAINAAYLRRRWEGNQWSTCFYDIGMEVETAGVSFAEVGLDSRGRTAVKPRSVLDTLWDPVNKQPQDWEYFFFRDHLTITRAAKKYPMVSRERLEELARPMRPQARTNDGSITEGIKNQQEILIVREWVYWSEDTHCVFLGDMSGDHEYLGLNEDLQFTPGIIGLNPFGVIPAVAWIDSWNPGVQRPMSKLETTWRLAAMLNILELYMRECILRGIPMTLLSTIGFGREEIEEMRNSRGPADLAKVLLIDTPDVSNLIHRIPAEDLPSAVMTAFQYYKDQLNSATGVMDYQRGQALTGERTAFEIKTLVNSQGVQARHTRNQYGMFLKTLIEKVRLIGALYEEGEDVLYIEGGVFDGKRHDIKQMLAYPMEIYVQEDSLAYKTEDESKMERMQEFQAVDIKAIELGVGNPAKIFKDVYEKLGVVNPDSRLYTEEEMAMIQMQQQQNAMLASSQETGGGGKKPAPQG